jgi:two-component system cell cycle sensor histidine kinase/response regulator CckA
MVELQTKAPLDPPALTLSLDCLQTINGQDVRYPALLDAAPDAIVLVNQSNTIVLVNAQAETLFGYGLDELIGKQTEILFSERCRSQLSDQHSRFIVASLRQPLAENLELFGLRKDGSEFLAEIRLSPLETDGGIFVSNAIRDISNRRRTEEDLRRFASIVACSDDAIIGKTLEGTITSWNAGAERIYGYSAAEIIGKPVSMLVPINRADEIPNILECLKRDEIVDHFETVRVRKDGKEIQVELTVSPIRDAMERIVGASTIGRDISERKQREKDLNRLAALVENSNDAIIGKTLDGIITNWNVSAQRIYGYSASEIVGKSISILFSPDQYAEITEMMEKIRRGESVENADTIRLRQDGKKIHVALALSPIKDSNGQVVGVSAVARDITESKLLEEMLRQAQKMEAVGRLAGGVAHDFNNLLGVILGYSELFLGRVCLTDLQRKDIEEIQKAGERGALLTRQLLAFSRKQVLQPKVLNLNTVVAGTEKLLQRLLGESIELRVVMNPALGRVKADSGQLEQILMNLAVNSRDAMPTGGQLTIETSNAELDERYAAQHASTLPGAYVMLAVTDTGCGMDANTKAHIFEPFFTTKEFGKGTGLGLATVYGIVKQSGGSVWVYTEPGIGTTFKIYLPRVDQFPDYEPPMDTIEKVDRGSQTILIVEDDADLLQVTCRSLEEFGYAILAARSPAEAIHISENHSGAIHLMVTDVIMPGMSGDKLASHLSRLRPEMKVLFVSGYTDETIVHHGVLEPGLAFLQKPISPRALAQKVSQVLAAALPFAAATIREK